MKKNQEVLKNWEDEKEGEIDKKAARNFVWRTRLTITWTVIRTILILLFLYFLYTIPVGVYYNMSGKQAEFDRFVATVVETRHAGISIDKRSAPQAEITPLLTQKTELTVYRIVGGWEVIVGEVTAKKRLFGDLQYTIDYDKKYLNRESEYRYAIAPDLLGETFPNEVELSKNQIAEHLNEMEDSFVVQMQFSTKESMNPVELNKLLYEYDVLVTQMPVYGGELTAFDINHHSATSNELTTIYTQSLMLRPFIEYGENNLFSSSYNAFDQVNVQESMEQFYMDIEWLLEQGDYPDKEIDQKRLDYIRENGINVYGATVTGSVREVEKLLQEDNFYEFNISGVEVWDWY